MFWHLLLWTLLLLFGTGAPAESSRSDSASPAVRIDQPSAGSSRTGDSEVWISGRAWGGDAEIEALDLLLVVDTSESTSLPTGPDLSALGIARRSSASPAPASGASVLGAEVAAALRLVRSLDARELRVGVLSFAGPPRLPIPTARPDTRLELPLSRSLPDIEAALGRILARGSAGTTHITAAIRHALRQLERGSTAPASPKPTRAILLLTDGHPTSPHRSAEENAASVMRAAQAAARAGVRVHAVAIGVEALRSPGAVRDLALHTGGSYTPVRFTGDLVEAIRLVSFAEIRSIRVQNRTLDRAASELVLGGGGSFDALVPLAPGINRIEVVAETTGGERLLATRRVERVFEAPSIGAPPGASRRLERVLELRLAALRDRNDELVLEHLRRAIASERSRIVGQRRELGIEGVPGVDRP